MARVVLGLGTSHTSMLLTAPSDWPKYESRDREIELVDQEGAPCSFEDLSLRSGEALGKLLTTEAFERAYSRCQESLDRLAEAVEEANPDAIIIIGDDRKELFRVENLPAMLVYRGDTIPKWVRRPGPADPSWSSDTLTAYDGWKDDPGHPVASRLARHLIESLVEQEFDPCQSTRLPAGSGESHALAFVHSRLLDHRPIPVVPVLLNTHYPPNQPTPHRCYRLGRALLEAVTRFPGDGRVAVVASGGLSHDVIDTDLDQTVLEAFATRDTETLTALPTKKLNSGNSEIRNWIVMVGASEHLSHVWTDYVPAYRTRAGTGTGCAFGVFR